MILVLIVYRNSHILLIFGSDCLSGILLTLQYSIAFSSPFPYKNVYKCRIVIKSSTSVEFYLWLLNIFILCYLGYANYASAETFISLLNIYVFLTNSMLTWFSFPSMTLLGLVQSSIFLCTIPVGTLLSEMGATFILNYITPFCWPHFIWDQQKGTIKWRIYVEK